MIKRLQHQLPVKRILNFNYLSRTFFSFHLNFTEKGNKKNEEIEVNIILIVFYQNYLKSNYYS